MLSVQALSSSFAQPRQFSRSQSSRNRAGRVGLRAAVRTMATVGDIKPIEQNSKLVKTLAEDVTVWAAHNGLLVVDTLPALFTHAPVSLLPTPFPRDSFLQSYRLADLIAELYANVAADGDFFRKTLKGAAHGDEFTRRILEMFEKVEKEGKQSPVDVALLRSDYMADSVQNRLLQVETNTIAASFGGLSPLVTKLHCEMVKRHGLAATYPADCLPKNESVEGLARGLAAAWTEVGNARAAVLVVVSPGERNWVDQQWLQASLREKHGVRTVRYTLAEVAALGSIASDGSLVVDGHAISVVYYRAGYAPGDFPSETEWKGREVLERSTAVKCPSLRWHLAGSKKVQQELALPGVVERFVSAETAKAVRECFAGLYALDGPGAAAVIEKAKARPDDFVLKPQREGGGNNFYGEEMRAKLSAAADLEAFILMERIRPVTTRALFLRKGEVRAASALSELGVYSIYLRNGKKVLINEPVGHLLRTKTADSNEGGVAAGFAVLDSPVLV